MQILYLWEKKIAFIKKRIYLINDHHINTYAYTHTHTHRVTSIVL